MSKNDHTRTRATLMLSNGKRRYLTAEAVRKATQTVTIADENVQQAVVDGRPYEPLSLVAQALSVDADSLHLRRTIQALQYLGFMPRAAQSHPSRELNIIRDETVDDHVDQGMREEIPRALWLELQRHVGEWVAIDDGKLLAFGQSLRDLRARLGDVDATFMMVPPSDSGEAG